MYNTTLHGDTAMASTEQLIVRLDRREKAQVASEAKRSDSTISDYVRRRLFDKDLPDADQALIQVLAELKPRVKKAFRVIYANLTKIHQLRNSATDRDESAATRARTELSTDELAAVADRLQLQAPSERPASPRRAARR